MTAYPVPISRPAASHAVRTARLLGAMLLALLILAACNRATEPVYLPGGDETVSVARLKSLCVGESRTIVEPLVISGSITANDERGELYRALIVEDDTGGIEISVGADRLYRSYAVGTQLTVSCQGLALGDYGGKVILGAPPTGGYVVDRIAEADLGRYLRPGGALRRPAAVRTIGALTLAMADTYARFDGVSFAAGEQGMPFGLRDTTETVVERHLTDRSGDTLVVRIRTACEYAAEPVPAGTGSVYGVIDYFGGRFSLRIVNRGIEGFTDAAPPTADLSAAGY